MNRLFFTWQANEDLIEIHDYIAGENPQAALRLVNQIEKRCKKLRIHPKSGRRRDELAPGRRSLVQEADYVVGEASQALPMLSSQVLSDYINRMPRDGEFKAILAFDEWLQSLPR
jgi:toxin ParE1/3/4